MKNLQRGVGRCLMAAVLAVVVVVGVGSMAAMAQTPSANGEAWVQMPPYSEPIKVQYEVVDGQAIWQGDIVLGDVDEVERMSAMIEHRGNASLLSPGNVSGQGLAISNDDRLWPMGIVPYRFDSSFDGAEERAIRDAINHIQEKTDIEFRWNIFGDRQENKHSIRIKDNGSGCSGKSPVGRQGEGITTVNLWIGGCVTHEVAVSLVAHEILHALGLYHEHQRRDRDDYIAVPEGKENDTANWGVEYEEDHMGRYDCNSIMHYHSRKALPTNDCPQMEGIGIFRPNEGKWFFDYNRDGSPDNESGPWGQLKNDQPFAGDLDCDGSNDDVGIFRSRNTTFYLDFNHDGERDQKVSPSDYGPQQDDQVIVGDFDNDGCDDDLGIFRPGAGEWLFDHGLDGKLDESSGPWGRRTDYQAIAGDFDCDGFNDDVGIFRSGAGEWFFDYDHDGVRDDKSDRRWGQQSDDQAIAGDFDNDGCHDDVGIYRSSNSMWYFDYNHDGNRDDKSGPLGMQTNDQAIAGVSGIPFGNDKTMSQGDIYTIQTLYADEFQRRFTPLKLFWSDANTDNFTTATLEGESSARLSGYGFSDVEGCVYPDWVPGTVPLKSFWNGGRADYFTTATQAGADAARSAGYSFVRTEGYVFPSQEPGTVPLKLFWSHDRKDNFTTATREGAAAARAAGYGFSDIEGYVYPASKCENGVDLDAMSISADQNETMMQPAPIQALEVSAIGLSQSGHQFNVRAQGQGIASLSLEMFGLSGDRVVTKTSLGNSLRFRPMDDAGRPLANGVYLYRTTVRGMNGQVERSEVKKLVILR